MRMEGFGKRYRGKANLKPAAKLIRKVIGNRIVIRYADGQYYINPEGTGTKELAPDVEQAVINMLAFHGNGRFPIPDKIVKSGIPISYEGF